MTICLDMFWLIELVIMLSIGIFGGLAERKKDKQEGDAQLKFWLPYSSFYFFQLLLTFAAVYYGIAWLRHGRTRKGFTKYYFTTLTLAGSAITNALVFTIAFSARDLF